MILQNIYFLQKEMLGSYIDNLKDQNLIVNNKGKINECIYLIELKYMTKTEGADKSSESTLKKLLEKASCEVLEYKSALNFKDKNVKAYVMVFAGHDCVYCKIQ